MPLILSGNVASATAAGYNVANSCRFNKADSAYMQKTYGSGSTSKATISVWTKHMYGSSEDIYQTWDDNSNYFRLRFRDTGEIELQTDISGVTILYKKTNALYRDPSAWMHICVIIDLSDGTAEDKVELHVNGVRITSFASSTNTTTTSGAWVGGSSDFVASVGRNPDDSNYYAGYLAEFVFIDGSNLAATSFGEFDSDSPTIWKPKDVSGLTFGTNGFYLDFEASDNLGNDANGGTDLSETNVAAVDQATDSPTNNFATFNPLHKTGTAAQQPLTEGNCIVTSASSQPLDRIASTLAVTKGKWYAEFKRVDGGGDRMGCGVFHYPIVDDSGSTFALGAGRNDEIGRYANMFGVKFGGEYQTNNSSVAFTSLSNGTVMGVFMDLDNHKLYFSKDGTIVSTTGKALTDNGEPYAFMVINEDASSQANFGGCPGFALSSAVADANGYGSFEYDPSQGGASNFDSSAKDFLALCTKNLGSDGG